MTDPYSASLHDRLSASREFALFGNPVRFTAGEKASWLQLRGGSLEGGLPWTDDLKKKLKGWPEHAFGTANAAVLLLWHRPGMGAGGSEPGGYLGPRYPNLGGIPHLHVKEWPASPSRPIVEQLDEIRWRGLRWFRSSGSLAARDDSVLKSGAWPNGQSRSSS